MALVPTGEAYWLDLKRKTTERLDNLTKLATQEGRDFTPTERHHIQQAMADVKLASGHLERIKADESFVESTNALFGKRSGGGVFDHRGSGLKVSGRLDANGFGDSLIAAATAEGRFGGRKALLDTGAITVPTPIVGDLRPDGDRPELVVDLLFVGPPNEGATRYRYLRQIARTNNAAPVAPGALKPTSTFMVTSVEDRTRTIAHLTEPIARQDLDDSEALRAFVATEMRNGVMVALDDQILRGDGLGENFEGILATSGTQAQPWDAAGLLVTARKAVTRMQVTHLTPTSWLMHPADWERFELSREGADGGFLMGNGPGAALPVDRSARKLWGVPVLPTVAVPEGTGILGDFRDLVLVVREDVRIDQSENVGTDFTTNQVRLRAEMRAGLANLRPASFVVVDLTAM